MLFPAAAETINGVDFLGAGGVVLMLLCAGGEGLGRGLVLGWGRERFGGSGCRSTDIFVLFLFLLEDKLLTSSLPL